MKIQNYYIDISANTIAVSSQIPLGQTAAKLKIIKMTQENYNGTEEANNSSNEPELFVGNNNSRHFAAVSKFLETDTLQFPVMVKIEGQEVELDFYSPKDGAVVKILTELNITEMLGYSEVCDLVDGILIIDAEKVRCGKCKCCRAGNICDSVFGAADLLDAYILIDDTVLEPEVDNDSQEVVKE